MTTFYNEFDKSAAAWLRELIAGGHIAPGVVDERSIEDISPDELAEYDQCHFFAGIGGWPLALKIAGWPDDRPVWTGSCPCQPYSASGAGEGDDDPRNLWWAFRWHIAHRKPAIVFGEQVESKAGRAWFAGVRSDLEGLGYAVGAADLCAASTGQEAEGWFVYPGGHTRFEPTTVSAPHTRQRLWWVADAAGFEFQGQQPAGHECRDGEDDKAPSRLVIAAGEQVGLSRQPRQQRNPDFWSAFDTVECEDGKTRRIESGSSPLAHGLPARLGRLRGYGNAINPWVAAEFIEAYGEARAMIPSTPSHTDSRDHTALREAGTEQNGDRVTPEN